MEGNNSGTGITATVTSSPGGQGLGSGYSFSDGSANAFVVTSGSITYADAKFIRGSDKLLVSTIDSVNYFPALDASGYIYVDNNPGAAATFTAAATPVPFEPNAAVGIATLGFCFGTAKVRKNHLAKKRMVSVEA
ncbi:hypothetical protein MEN41_18315 [Dolichospermum sp. ST_con]|nr:hypothetical protein [Dolichospermum sp. ST_con]MDD1423555.1 hypothetical protein [Dolichospermum sp. ST_sed9]MDD1431718.1 hypothetical protein [Dolichospermum sp. ST_sed6]MDD1445522.1 hypothetical protein [Dolichospermum sp. ST_sed8]MDD1459391.1 hypothetical protein [Dolichospermum sp. ST_sed2]MDD1466983.1 hypothetical protein [Dolichospermum sp. ST_sed5]